VICPGVAVPPPAPVPNSFYYLDDFPKELALG